MVIAGDCSRGNKCFLTKSTFTLRRTSFQAVCPALTAVANLETKMALNPLVDSRDVRFVLFEMFNLDRLSGFESFSDVDRHTMEATISLAEQIAVKKIFPANLAGEKEGGVKYDPATKEVHVPAAYREALASYYEAGFLALAKEREIGGMGLPETLFQVATEYFCAASIPFTMYVHLAFGTVNLIKNYGTKAQKELYLEKLIGGEWGSTMCLTEPGAGSDVGALKTRAVKQPDGTYLITGQKIFITNGDSDLYENIIHPVLARIDGDPAGTKGISIFLVPKYIVNPDGSLGDRNDVVCTGVEHKMGLKGSATCSLSFGDEGRCVGTILGEERKGMSIMFQMINESRLYVAIQALGVSSAAYLHALMYSRVRVQGSDIASRTAPEPKSVTIIRHPDVRRMLLWMKSHVDAMRMICYFIAICRDLHLHSTGEEAKEAGALIDFLIPIAKGGNSDLSWLITAEAIQVLGGYGFCADYPVEQFARDSKIQSIYEGTNAIQAVDLMMRKMLQDAGQYRYSVYRKRIAQTLEAARPLVERRYVDAVERALAQMDEYIGMMKNAMNEGKIPQLFANATPLLTAFRMLTHAWLHLWSLSIALPRLHELAGEMGSEKFDAAVRDSAEAAFYAGRVLSARFFLGAEFCKFEGQMAYLRSGEQAVLYSRSDVFTGAPEA